MKTTLCLTLLTFIMLVFVPNSFAQDEAPEYIVCVLYFLPNDREPQPDIDTKLDTLMKDAQKFYADVMASYGFGRKTFTLETDENGKVLIHHVNAESNDTYYHNGTLGKVIAELNPIYDTSKHIYYVAIDVSSERFDVDQPNSHICGQATGAWAATPASGECFNYRVIAHELGHNFGLSHDRINYSGIDAMVDSFCAAEWLDVHPYFNEGSQTDSNELTKINMLNPSRAPSSNTVRFSFEVNDADGLHQAQLYIPTLDSVVAYKRLNSENATVDFDITHVISELNSIILKVIDVNGNHTSHHFPVDISEFLLPPKKVTIPDTNLAAAIRAYTDLPPNADITTDTMMRLTRLWNILPVSDAPITDITGLEHATNLVALSLYGQNEITDFSALDGLRELRFLELSRTGISDLSMLSASTKLKTLHLENNAIKDISVLVGFTNLKRLDLWNNQISDITPISELTNLTYLDLHNNRISDVSPLVELTNLQELRLEKNPIKNKKPLLELLRKNPDVKIYLKWGSNDPLPVTLSHFRAERTNAGVILKWTTDSEVDNAGFYIYRSETSGGEFKIVNPTMIQGAGTTGEQNEYTWTDTTAKPNTIYYYRIEDVSHAGVREQLATVRLRGLVSASGKLITRWSQLKRSTH